MFSSTLTTSGSIAGRDLITLTAENIRILGGSLGSDEARISARNDLISLGGSVQAKQQLIAQAGHDLRVESTTRTQTTAQGSRTAIDRVAGLYVSGQNGTLIASAGNDFTLIAAALINAAPTAAGVPGGATTGITALLANRNLTLGTVRQSTSQNLVWDSKNTRSDASQTDIGSIVQSDGALTLHAGRDLAATAARVSSASALNVLAERSLTLNAGQSSVQVDEAHQHTEKGFLSSTTRSTRDTLDQSNAQGSTLTGQSVTVQAQDIRVTGSTLSADAALRLIAERDLTIDSAQDTRSETHRSAEQFSGFSASLRGGINIGSSSLKQSAAAQSVSQVASTLSGQSISTSSGRDTTVTASSLLADQDASVLAGRNLDILAAANTQDTQSQTTRSDRSHGFGGGLSARTTIYSQTSSQQDGNSSTSEHVTSLLSANSGDLTLRAGLDAANNGTGTGKLTTQGADLLAKQAITLTGKAIDLQAVANESASHSVEKHQSVTIGSALAGALGEQITRISDAIDSAQHTDNDRLKGALVLKAGYDAYKLASGKPATQTVPTGADANAPAADSAPAAASTVPGAGSGFASSGLGVSISINRSTSQSESSSQATQVSGTNLQGKTITLSASETDLAMAAAKLQAESITLDAKRDIILEAAANTSELRSSNKSSSVGGGVTFAFGGQQNGFSFQLNASRAKGQANGSESTWDNTLITASDLLSVTSGRDATLMGAQLAGQTVRLDIGRDLAIQTLQDSSIYASTQTSSGFNISLCIPPICGGAPVSGSFSASRQSIKHNYLSAVGQSGIAAGAGGFDITVGQHTGLVGAAITGGRETNNRLVTASLESRDLENVQSMQAKSSNVSLSGSAGASALTTVAGNLAQNVMGNLQGNAALPKNGSEQGVTQSVISPASVTITGTGNTARDEQSQQSVALLTSRDPATANGSLKNTLTLQQTQALQNEIRKQQENMEAAKLVGAVLSNVVGDVAASMRKPVTDAQLRQQLDIRQESGQALSASERTELTRLDREGMNREKAAQTLADPAALANYTNWQDGSLAKTALHGLAGLIEAKIGGGSAAAGALSGMAHEALVPVMTAYLNSHGFDDSSPAKKAEFNALMNVGSTLLGAAVGALAGGNVKGASTGANVALIADVNNRQLHAAEKSLAKRLAKESNGKYTVEQMEDALRWANNSKLDETSLSNTTVVLNAGTTASQITDASSMTLYTNGDRAVLYQDMSKISVPNTELMAFIQQQTGSVYSS